MLALLQGSRPLKILQNYKAVTRSALDLTHTRTLALVSCSGENVYSISSESRG